MSKRVQNLRLERDHWKWRAEVAEKQNKELRECIDKALLEGLDSGPATPMSDDWWSELRNKVRVQEKGNE